jgi:hypothetical protein
MNTELIAINLRNILLLQLLVVLSIALNIPIIHRDLLRFWNTLKAPFLMIKSTKTNHPSNKFWEIDMTKFEP